MKDNRELIDHIKEVLHQHQEPYKEGSWEKFMQQTTVPIQKKRFPYWAAAACLLLLAGIGLWAILTPSTEENNIAQNQAPIAQQENIHTAPQNKSSIIADSIYADSQQAITVQNNPTEKNIPQKKSLIQRIADAVLLNNQNDNTYTQSVQQPNIDNNKNETVANQYIKESNKSIAKKQESNENAQNQTQQPQQQPQQYVHNIYTNNNPVLGVDDDNFKKWNFAAQVGSSFSNNSKMNMSYGINVGYALNDKIAVHSGISYAQLHSAVSHTNINERPMMMSAAPSNESNYAHRSSLVAYNNSQAQPQTSDLRLSGVEIPVEVRYNVSKKLYTNVGISAMALIENTQKNTYIVESPKTVGFATYADNPTSEILEKREETISGTGVVKDKFLEFVNMSFGYKQPISDKRNIRIEPFIKIPINSSGVKVPLTNAGVRLGIDL